MPMAATTGDPLECLKHVIPDCPTAGVIMPRVGTVNIGFMPAAREGDKTLCVEGGEGVIILGEPTVRIEGHPAARMGDPMGHSQEQPSGVIQLGFPTVMIGSMAQVGALQRAAREGSILCEDCPKPAGDDA